MADPSDSAGGVGPDDEALTAWLDGELSAEARAALDGRLAAEPALAARLDVLQRGVRMFAPAFDVLLAAAPTERLNAMLAGVAAERSAAAAAPASPGWSRGWIAAAAAIVFFAVGAVAGYLVPLLTAPSEEQPGWRQVVAEYYTLVTPESLEVISADPAALSLELQAIGGKLDLDLTPDRLALADAALKRAQLYDFRGRPLVQLAYLTDTSGPIALCIIANGRADAPPAFEEREGSNVVFWTRGGRGYMLIGHTASRAALEAYAGDLEGRFS